MCFRSKSSQISDLPPARVPVEVERPRMSAEEKQNDKTKLATDNENQEYGDSIS
jgi:hypothetical protein